MDRKRFTVGLPVDPEDVKKMLSDPNAAYSKKLLEERERRFDANLLAAIKGEPVPYPLPEGMFDDDICPYCGHQQED